MRVLYIHPFHILRSIIGTVYESCQRILAYVLDVSWLLTLRSNPNRIPLLFGLVFHFNYENLLILVDHFITLCLVKG